eukprot:scaffold269876_cov33-Tisochrysis_lutea.AAC.3
MCRAVQGLRISQPGADVLARQGVVRTMTCSHLLSNSLLCSQPPIKFCDRRRCIVLQCAAGRHNRCILLPFLDSLRM